MYQCHVCGSNQSHPELVNEVFQIKGKIYLVEKIPAQVCSRCGEFTFSRETTEKVRKMLHGDSQPVDSIKIDVFAY
ncbi:YgiT-type zinc finger protein [[Phormidium] sp. ETS-05]|uniref:YgiT-type zinc finger protein n=1 Tax=[Phormidium] sp. ETS-05 TaxID=222819 RepID=UPI0018EEFA10|nr:YgiT-type zinc finger protein [[Phormidium] sp. ETS-05]